MTGTLRLLRSALRRDRWMLLWWAVGLIALYWLTAVSVAGIYDTQQALDEAAAAIESNPSYVALSGPAQGVDTLGGQVAWNCQVFGGVVIGLMTMFLVIRHTRAEEETGRDELLRATPVGRLAPAASGVLVSLLASLVIGLLCGLSVMATGLAPEDSLAMGLGLAGCGFVFTASAWTAAQVASTSRAAYGLAGAAVGLAYGLRAIGDVNAAWLSWLSPIGWYSALQAFAGLRWWVLGLSLAASAVSMALAAWLITRRDYGAGLVSARPGPAAGRMGSAAALTARLHRPTVLGWMAGMFLGGIAYGAIGDSPGEMLGDNEQMTEMLAAGGVDLLDGFYGTALVMLSVIACGYAVGSALRPRHEEESTHAELLMSTRATRVGWLLGHVAATLIGSLLVLASAGAGLGLGYWLVTGDGAYAWGITWPVLQYVPAVLALSGVTRLLYGVLPRWCALGWLPVVYVAVVLFFGEMLDLPDWSRWLSPFEHLALVPAADLDPTPILIIGAVALALSVVGQAAFRRRDVG